jgi:hypothetical protein
VRDDMTGDDVAAADSLGSAPGVWKLFGYPPTPTMPPGALPRGSGWVLDKAEGLAAWRAVFEFGVDGGRTEGAMIASAAWLTLILFVLLTALAVAVLSRLMGKRNGA